MLVNFTWVKQSCEFSLAESPSVSGTEMNITQDRKGVSEEGLAPIVSAYSRLILVDGTVL
jgi:hypothetical protein